MRVSTTLGVQVAERTPAQIQAEIEGARVALASSLDQLAERTSPKRLADQAKEAVVEKATSDQGKKIIAGSVAAVVALVVLARVRRARKKPGARKKPRARTK
jgi:Protein of unknown function (DUF3618)